MRLERRGTWWNFGCSDPLGGSIDEAVHPAGCCARCGTVTGTVAAVTSLSHRAIYSRQRRLCTPVTRAPPLQPSFAATLSEHQLLAPRVHDLHPLAVGNEKGGIAGDDDAMRVARQREERQVFLQDVSTLDGSGHDDRPSTGESRSDDGS